MSAFLSTSFSLEWGARTKNRLGSTSSLLRNSFRTLSCIRRRGNNTSLASSVSSIFFLFMMSAWRSWWSIRSESNGFVAGRIRSPILNVRWVAATRRCKQQPNKDETHDICKFKRKRNPGIIWILSPLAVSTWLKTRAFCSALSNELSLSFMRLLDADSDPFVVSDDCFKSNYATPCLAKVNTLLLCTITSRSLRYRNFRRTLRDSMISFALFRLISLQSIP